MDVGFPPYLQNCEWNVLIKAERFNKKIFLFKKQLQWTDIFSS